MKLLLVVLIASLSLLSLCSCLDDDYQGPGGDNVGEEGEESLGRVNEDEVDHDSTLDEEALVGGKAARRKLIDMPKEEAQKEIRKLVERIDTNDDGQLDRGELYAWLNKVEDKAFADEAASVFAKEDTNKDGYVTVEEYIANSGLGDDYDADKEEMEQMRQSIQEKFSIADADKDGRLSQKEFGVFVHPDRHEEMTQHLIRDQLSRYDIDGDGRISLEEYMKHYNPGGKSLDDMPDWIKSEQREFEQKLDANKDGFLDEVEMQQWIAPNDEEFINEEVEHLLGSMDDNKDDQLSYEEVMEEFDVLMESPITDFGQGIHEEL